MTPCPSVRFYRPQMKEAQFSTRETTMMQHTTVQALGQARLADLRHQAQRASLVRAARRARRVRRQSGRRAPGLLAALTGWARRPRPALESS